VAQDVGPTFKPHYHQNKKQTNKQKLHLKEILNDLYFWYYRLEPRVLKKKKELRVLNMLSLHFTTELATPTPVIF
jgi:hypothetical protein